MLKVNIELHPGGSKTNKKLLTTANIVNDGTGTVEVGNYKMDIFNWTKSGVYKRGKVKGFKRLKWSPWYLLHLALKDIFEK